MNPKKETQKFVKVTERDLGKYIRVQWNDSGVVDAILVDMTPLKAFCFSNSTTLDIDEEQIIHVGKSVKPPHLA